MKKINEIELKEAIKKIIIEWETFLNEEDITENVKEQINEEYWGGGLKKRIKDKTEYLLSEDVINEGGVYNKIIDDFSMKIVNEIKISFQPNLIKKVFNNNEFDKLWEKVKLLSDIKSLLK